MFLRSQRLYALLFFFCSIFGIGVLVPLNLAYSDELADSPQQFPRTTMAMLPRRQDIENAYVYRYALPLNSRDRGGC